ncbi:MAG TPA: BadF/BadG/BcrA/BcrD ATPase family protein [Bryobacteraceae bacterium]|nr:BadF/BadG/BcrA/BcrD ATPase family protein [Bryobacteraceae bacterium]
MSRIYLGVDGGQSGTTALIGDESGRVLGMGRSGPCNHVKGPGGREKFVNALGGSVREALRAAGLDEACREFAAACMGFSGGPTDKQALIEEMFAISALDLTTDMPIALSGASAGQPGIITNAGTGSFSYGRNAAGETARVGGWGYIFGDEGGGFDTTRQALRAVLRNEEGWGPATTLRDHLLSATGASSANDLLHRFYTTDYPRPMIASYSKLVDEAAREGDAVARDILHAAAQQLATSAAAVRRQLFVEGNLVLVYYIGSLFKSDFVRERFRTLVELEDGNRVQTPTYGPAAGALIEAYRLAHIRAELTAVPEEKG